MPYMFPLPKRAGTQVFSVFVILFTSLAWGSEGNWPQWRGSQQNGHTEETDLPTRWNAASVVWKVPLPGVGQSSPTIWKDRMFLTSALENGKQRLVFCVHVPDGKILWQQVAWQGEPEPSHKMNGWASATCATDGEVVVAFFGKGGLHAYTIDGKHLWSRDLGEFTGPWGTAACPVLFENLVIQNGDSDQNAFIEAFDRLTGKTVWRKKRPDHRGWSTPVLVPRGNKPEVVVNGHEGVVSYEPTTGAELWFTPNSNGRGEPTVTPGSGLLYVVCGLAGDMYALRPGDPSSKPQVVWKAARRSGRDLPSPIVIGDYVLVSSLSGIATCYEAPTGKELWRERLEGQFSSSPIAINGLALFQSETGETVVIKPGPTFEIVSRNRLEGGSDEIFRASLTPSRGRIYSRSTTHLYCIASPKVAARR